MTLFLLRRLGLTMITMVFASFFVFALNEYSAGNVARKVLGMYATDEQLEILNTKLKVHDPLLVRYFRWMGVLGGVIEDPLGDPSLKLNFDDPRGHKYFGNFGYSLYFKTPVNDIIWGRLLNTAKLAGLAFAIILPLSVFFGVLCGIREGSLLDRSLSIISIILTSIPEFASAVILITVFVVLLGWLPGTSQMVATSDWSVASQFVLPVLVLVLYDFGYVARMMRSSMVDVMATPYIRTAVLKGLHAHRVILRHALRTALITPFTVFMLQLTWLLTGVVVTEVVFSYPGFGRMLLDAALGGDIALIEAGTIVALIVAAATQLIADIGYMYLDPRIRVS